MNLPLAVKSNPEREAYLFGLLDAIGAGTDAPNIAARLYALGVRGRRDSFTACPIAVYLREMLTAAGHDGLRVSTGENVILVTDAACKVTWARVPTDLAVSWFIRRFDAGDYPSLYADGAK